jgi:large subunit ribosomal protein L7/L12
MLGLGPPELLILLAVLLVLLLAVGVLGRASSSRRPAPPVTVTVPAELQSRLRAMAAADQRISAIKLLRKSTGLSLLDAKNAVDAIAAGAVLPAALQADLASRARSLVGAGREDEAVRLVAAETGMSVHEATTFVRALSR